MSVTLDDDVLDRIDQIVPPGVTMNPAGSGLAATGARRPRRAPPPRATRAAS
jgi:hypothetical protein